LLSPDPAIAASKPVIAVILPETGAYSTIAGVMRSAVNLAWERMTQEQRISFNLKFVDNYTNPDSARAIAERLCSQANVIGLMGGFPSSCSQQLAAIAEQQSIPYLIISASADTLTRCRRKNSYRIGPPFADYNDGLVAWTATVVGENRTLTVICEEQTRAKEVIDDLTEDLKFHWRGQTTKH